jgi:phosphoribosylformylglycinamidine cyclo-ligase
VAGALDPAELRATLNAGLGMVAVVPAAAVDPAVRFLGERDIQAWHVGEVVAVDELGGVRYQEVSG